MNKVDKIISCIKPASRELYERYFLTLQNTTDSILSRQNIINGWAQTGLWPPNVNKIMSNWPGWIQLSPEQQQIILDGLKVVALQITGDVLEYENQSNFSVGVADDSLMELLFSKILGPVKIGQILYMRLINKIDNELFVIRNVERTCKRYQN